MSDGWDVVNEYADTVASMVEEENKLKELLRDIYAEAAASWGTSGANAALERIKALTQRYGNPTACPTCPDPGGCALPDGTFDCRNAARTEQSHG